jgi:hypothetical protein
MTSGDLSALVTSALKIFAPDVFVQYIGSLFSEDPP